MGTAELIAAGTFFGVMALIVAPYYLLVVRTETATQEMLRQRIRTGAGTGARAAAAAAGSLFKDVERLSTIGPLNQLLGSDSTFARDLRDVIQLSGLKITPGQLVLGSGCLLLLGYLVAATYTGQAWAGLVFGVVVAVMPYVAVRIVRSRRLNRFEEQFPEAVDVIARTLRAGHAFPTGLRMAADELPDPVAGEFRLLHDQQNYGLPMNDALKAFARRVPLIDARFFVTAVLTQREAGGNLAEVLDNLSAVIRERFKIKRQLRVISAHGRLTGLVLAALPPALAVFLAIRVPGHFRVLIEDPVGVRMIVVAIVLQLVGAFLIRKITRVEY
jgi:tight adherence protein B